MKEYTRDGLTLEESKHIHIETKEIENEDGTVTFVKQKVCHDKMPPLIRYEAGRSCSRYVAEDKGIVEEWDVLDQYGEVLHKVNKLLLPKETFVKAFKKYIKEDE